MLSNAALAEDFLKKYHTTAARAMRPTKPPTAPPTIAPTFEPLSLEELLFCVVGCGG